MWEVDVDADVDAGMLEEEEEQEVDCEESKCWYVDTMSLKMGRYASYASSVRSRKQLRKIVAVCAYTFVVHRIAESGSCAQRSERMGSQ